jgi:hypothetical protein
MTFYKLFFMENSMKTPLVVFIAVLMMCVANIILLRDANEGIVAQSKLVVNHP